MFVFWPSPTSKKVPTFGGKIGNAHAGEHDFQELVWGNILQEAPFMTMVQTYPFPTCPWLKTYGCSVYIPLTSQSQWSARQQNSFRSSHVHFARQAPLMNRSTHHPQNLLLDSENHIESLLLRCGLPTSNSLQGHTTSWSSILKQLTVVKTFHMPPLFLSML